MMDNRAYRWSNKQLRTHVEVLDGGEIPHIILKDATYLNSYLHEWEVANIWIYEDRIIYVGENLPENIMGIEVIDCVGQYVVPGYIEPHIHPYQIYNPLTFAKYAGQFGTTTLISDNLTFTIDLTENNK